MECNQADVAFRILPLTVSMILGCDKFNLFTFLLSFKDYSDIVILGQVVSILRHGKSLINIMKGRGNAHFK